MPTQIRDADFADFEAIRALNQSEVQHTSALDVVRLTELHGLSCYHRVAVVDGTVAAFVLAMCGGADPALRRCVRLRANTGDPRDRL